MRRITLVWMLAFLLGACAGAVEDDPTATQGDVASPSTASATPSESEPAPLPTETTTTVAVWDQAKWAAEDGPAALALVERFYSALNAGDADLIRTLSPDAFFDQGDSRITIAVEGVGARFDYECALSESQPEVICKETVTDHLYGPAGIINQAIVRYDATAQNLSVVADSRPPFVFCGDPEGSTADFLVDFHTWTLATHPELSGNWVWGEPSESRVAIPCTPYPFHTPEGAAEVCEFVAEFVAQSDRWPKSDA